jgi:hypothetical protein|mmetsp:Transcript_43896/g.58202  ORF Transcript_43896/g.58202 Transcript_43896/m.58202 type:complete len:95 (+) Transcript_43896:2405-2689(+)
MEDISLQKEVWQNAQQQQMRPMINFSDNMIRDARVNNQDCANLSGEALNPYKQQKVITFKGRDYLLYEGRIIDEREADRIYTQYHEILSHKKVN